MERKRILWVMPVLVLALGMAFAGCKTEDEPAYSWTYANNSDHTVNVSSEALAPSKFSLNPNSSKTATSSTDTFDVTYTPADKVTFSQSENRKVITFVNK